MLQSWTQRHRRTQSQVCWTQTRLLLFPWTWTSFYPSKPAGNGASCVPPWQPCLCLPFPGNSLEKVHWPWMTQIAKMLLPAQCCPPPRQPHSGRSPFHRSPSMHLPDKRENITQVGQDWAILLPSLLGARITGLHYQNLHTGAGGRSLIRVEKPTGECWELAAAHT